MIGAGAPSPSPADGDSASGSAGEDLPVDAVVPASGRSTRMGSPKPLLDADGRSFLQKVVGALSGGGCRRILVVVRDPSGPIGAMGRRAGGDVVENPDPAEGPISSLQAGLRRLDDDAAGCAYCPVDHPLVRPGTVRRLLDAFRDSAAPLVVPRFRDRRGHPVVFRRSLFGELMADDLPEGARTVVHRHDDEVLEVEVEDRGVTVDIDTLQEYRRHFPDAYRKRFQSR